jgi:hypothetical protein
VRALADAEPALDEAIRCLGLCVVASGEEICPMTHTYYVVGSSIRGGLNAI